MRPPQPPSILRHCRHGERSVQMLSAATPDPISRAREIDRSSAPPKLQWGANHPCKIDRPGALPSYSLVAQGDRATPCKIVRPSAMPNLGWNFQKKQNKIAKCSQILFQLQHPRQNLRMRTRAALQLTLWDACERARVRATGNRDCCHHGAGLL